MKKSIQVTWLCSRADIYSMQSPSASITAAILIRNWEHGFSTSSGGSSANTQRIAVIRLSLVLWEVMLVMFSTYDQTKLSSSFRSGEEGPSERRVQSRSTTSEAKPGFLWTCGPAPSPAATPRICHRPPDRTRGSPHSSAHLGTLWWWLSSRLRRCKVAKIWPSLETTPKTITVARKFVFITPGTFLLFVTIQICILRVLAMVLLS